MIQVLRAALFAVFFSSLLSFSDNDSDRSKRMFFSFENVSPATAYNGALSTAFIDELDNNIKNGPASSQYNQKQNFNTLLNLIRKHNILVSEGNIDEIFRSMGVYQTENIASRQKLKDEIVFKIKANIPENMLYAESPDLKFTDVDPLKANTHRRNYEVELKMILYDKKNKGLSLRDFYLKVLVLSKKHSVVMDDSFFRNYLPKISNNLIEASSIEYLAIVDEFVPKADVAGACENCTFRNTKLTGTEPKNLGLKGYACKGNCGTKPFYINGHLVRLTDSQKTKILHWLDKDVIIAAKKLSSIHGSFCAQKLRQNAF